jgi:hypothetical protein
VLFQRLTTYRKSGRLFILRDMEMFQQLAKSNVDSSLDGTLPFVLLPMSKTAAAKIAWLSLAFLIAVPLVVMYNPTANRDNDLVLGYALLALTFPTGFVVAALYAVVGYVLGTLFSAQLPVGRLAMILDCVVFLTAGYLQWFVVVPAIWTILRKKQPRTGS